MKRHKSSVERFTRVSPVSNVLFHLLLILLATASIVPLFLVISISLTDEGSIRDYGYRLIPKVFSWESYNYLYRQRVTLLRSLGTSVFVTAVGTALGVILTSTMGYGLSRVEFRLHKFYTWFIFIPMIFNGGMVSSYVVVTRFLGLRNSPWALILPLCVSSFYVIVCRTFFRSTIPDSLIESATIDGAGQLTVYFRIILPLSLPVLATIGLFLSFAYWNDWFQSMLYIDRNELLTLQAYLNRILDNINFLASNAGAMGLSQSELLATLPREGARMAIAVIAVLPIACVYPFFQRYFISGLTVGAVKG
ncbi:MAG: carbohydrate ABC transporter permease [Treponema sp.]|jgi:putative aldouronate transport system permease protein|nr:carbohydrate ABC transporter permease [Treponema sp.]